MRKAMILLALLSFASYGLAADAVISPNDPQNDPTNPLELNSSNNYEFEKQFDGSGSSPDSVSYSWQWVEASESESGPLANFTFDRDSPAGNSQPQTIKLIVTSGSDSAESTYSQELRDVPNATVTPDQTTVDISNSDTDVDFSSEVTNVFNRPDSGIVDHSWSIEGSEVDTTSNFTYNFEDNDTDTYTVELNVSDAKDFWSTDSVDIDVVNNTDSNVEDSGGGGGGGLSTSDYDSVNSIAGNVTDGEEEVIDVETQAFRTLSFTATENITQPEFGINVQDAKPAEASEDPNGDIYVYFELDEENVSSSEVEDVELDFRVDDNWIESRSIGREKIHLLRYDSGWEPLDTSYVETKNGYMHFTADSPGLSVFAVSGYSADIQAAEISLSSSDIAAQESFDIEVTFENKANGSGWEEFDISVADSNYSQNVSLDGSSETTVSFSESLSAGNYTVEAGSESYSFEVLSSSSVGDGEDQLTTQSDDGSETQDEDDDSGNQTATDEQKSGSGLPWIPMIAGFGVFIGIVGAAGYHKREEIQDFMDEHELDPQIQFEHDFFGSSEDAEQMGISEKYGEVKEELEELGIQDSEVSVKMDHAKMLIDQDKEAEAREVLEEVTERVLDQAEE